MIKDTIYCSGCQKHIDLYENTTVKKNERWDLVCTSCGNWLGSLKSLLGWTFYE
jgi:hypothetical protein